MSKNRVVVALAVAAVLGIGLIVLQRWVAQTRDAAIVLVAIWFVVAGIAAVVASRRRPDLRLPILGTYAGVLVASLAVGYWTGFRDDVVDEEVVVAAGQADETERAQGLAGGGAEPTASVEAGGEAKPKPDQPEGPVELATGEFAGADGHTGTGLATVIRDPGGERQITFTSFDVDPGPTVEVWLTRGADSLDDRINLGTLRGNVGDQQYDIPNDADLGEYDTVVLYCIPFTTRIAVAPLG